MNHYDIRQPAAPAAAADISRESLPYYAVAGTCDHQQQQQQTPFHEWMAPHSLFWLKTTKCNTERLFVAGD